jgi:hypothetical protein
VNTDRERWQELLEAATPVPAPGTWEAKLYDAWLLARVEVWLKTTLALMNYR